MTTLSVLSRAKINWYLRVLDRRPDGYHNIETIFQEIDLADTLHFTPTDEPTCCIFGFPPSLPTEANLIHRAWAALKCDFPDHVGGVKIQVQKNIPAGGGLGGGSSNAAATLRALTELFAVPVTLAELSAIAAQLGSDVPFFLAGGCAIGRGRGEILQPVNITKPIELVLVFPDEGISTAEAYNSLSQMNRPPATQSLADCVERLQSGDAVGVASSIHNDFELVVNNRSWFRNTVSEMKSAGCARAFLTGSGSTIVGVTPIMGASDQVVQSLQAMVSYRASTARTIIS